MKNPIDILELTLSQLESKLKDMDIAGYRAKQIYSWLYRGTLDFTEMTNISKDMQNRLSNRFNIANLKMLESIESDDGSTIKFLFLLKDENIIECVVMEYSYGNTICISTQVGCKMGCSFCASSKGGFVRDLSTGEMISQILTAKSELSKDTKEYNIKNIVLMGSGEPLDNYDNTIKFLKMIHDPDGLNLSYRNMTLSTCGIVDKIYKLSEENMPITLAISLHAPNDSIRRKIMPISSRYSIDDIFKASDHYFQETGRRITLEYALIDGINDRYEDALELGKRIGDYGFHVNIIPINEISDSVHRRSSEDTISQFINVLRDQNINVSRRRELGTSIQGACGQLRYDYLGRYVKRLKGE
ncbi:MAG: 23S rRNA (adenine(2503)-C(2))-methyltransferase RlmN [Clostridiales bacterium]|nr:23S rRNA (adenine(2503)-C(2))-methyltransferase RlmN [Clostridiales bacterium]